MSVFDGLSSREIGRRTQTYIGYMYLEGMQYLSYRTILRFKRDYYDLMDDVFKTTVKIAREEV
ncbi:transposase [uncultured Methanobrevibacter sp.]|uniref:transposase n=1 Tax=uncultured Methanobrevibacter sp. TaxID=253161 RepID=UPI0025E4D93E|nr:transposase [uncultured Methanobrevibacter sp.]